MNSNRFSFVAILLALGLVFGMVWSTPANADNLYASIRGTVVDPSGAVVAGAKLTATNIATGLTYKDTSDKDGTFAFLQLPIGDYSVKIEKSGFKSFNEGHIHLDIAQIFALKAAMELGSVSDTVTVEANAAQVESTDMQLSATITGSQIVDIPLNGRNWAQVQTAVSPNHRSGTSLTYDAAIKGLVLFGGWTSDYQFTSSNWFLGF